MKGLFEQTIGKIGSTINKNISMEVMASYCKGDTLDIGCGKGNNNIKKYARSVTGMDIEHFNPDYGEFIKEDFSKINTDKFRQKFDTIYSREFIEHISDHKDFLDKCRIMLKENGLLIFSSPTPMYWKTIIGNTLFPKGKTSNKNHISVVVPRIINNLAENCGFSIIDVKPQTRFNIPFFVYQMIYIYRKNYEN